MNKQKPYAVEVPKGFILILSMVNAQEGDAFAVHRVIEDWCGDINEANDIPLSPCGKPVTIDETHNPVILEIAGRYRVYPVGVVSDTVTIYKELQEKACCG